MDSPPLPIPYFDTLAALDRCERALTTRYVSHAYTRVLNVVR